MVTRNHDYIPELRSVIKWHWGPPANVVALNAKSRCLANHCLDDLRPDPVGITMTYIYTYDTNIYQLVGGFDDRMIRHVLFSPLGY